MTVSHSDVWDGDGYPTEETLEKIRTWPEDWNALLEFVRGAWMYNDRILRSNCEEEYHPGDLWCLSTGGWSGNESIIEALQGNAIFWLMCWWSSRRGGHFQFIVARKPTPAPAATADTPPPQAP